jgi:hypothetical protein
VGFAGVSRYSILIAGSALNNPSAIFKSRRSSIMAVILNPGRILFTSSLVPPYNEKWVRILSPGFNVASMSVEIAAIPDE